MKGIILAGGSGSRLYPITKGTSKQLLSIYDKPMIYYPLSVLMLSGIKDILIISNPENLPNFKKLFSNGSDLGLRISYLEQKHPDGIAQAFILGAKFLDGAPCVLVLGDNIFYGAGFSELLLKLGAIERGSVSFAYYVHDPERYGVCKFAEDGSPMEIQEKPQQFLSNWALTGLYFYDDQVVDVARSIRPSARGELEITAVNQYYLERKQLHVEKMGRGYAWLDAGTHASLLEASQFVYSIEQRQGLKIGCPEEVAWRMGFITTTQLEEFIHNCCQPDYAGYLRKVLEMDK